METYTDPATGRPYTVGPDGRSRWLDEQPYTAVTAAPGQPVVAVVSQPVPSNAMHTTALVLGILGFLTCGLTGVIAIPVGHVALSTSKRRPKREGYQLALAGLICGYLSIAMWVLRVASAMVE